MQKFRYILLALTLFVSDFASAELTTAMTIRSDYFVNTVYEIGFDVNSNHLIDSVYFTESNQAPVHFTLNELQKNYAVVFKRWGFEFVRMKIISMDTPTSGVIELSYLRNFGSGARNRLLYSVRLTPYGIYEVVDQRSGKATKNALVVTNYKHRIPIGIRDIESK